MFPRIHVLLTALIAAVVLAPPAWAQTATYTLEYSTTSDRASAQALDGSVVAGTIYVVASPGTGTQARFWLDNPAMTGTPRQTENNPPWDFAGGNKDGTARPFDTRTVADGEHVITVAVTQSDGALAVSSARLVVDNATDEPPPPSSTAYQLDVSSSGTRSNPVALSGAAVKGVVYVFASPGTGSGARFWLDDPAMSGTPRTTERSAPWDFLGTASDGTAKPWDTRAIDDGAHTITAAITQASGAVDVVHASFTVANQVTSPALSFDASSKGFATAPGADPAPQSVLLSTVGSATADFTLTDDAPWLTLSPTSGAAPAQVTLTVAASALALGTHTATVTASAPGHTSDTLAVSVTVAEPSPPDQIHLSWTQDTATTFTAAWRTREAGTPSTMQYRAVGAVDWQTVAGGPRASGTEGQLHEATATGLAPATTYEYRVLGDGGRWSEPQLARTAPTGPGDFDAIYFGDTGLIGRADGLATGTAQVRDEITAMDPLVILGGGDYAYFNTDTRFGTLERTIDEWFSQWSAAFTKSAIMPTYGNHEVFLGEGYANWQQRFPYPAGFDGRRTYSFDVGDVHFISIFAASDGTGGLRSGTEAWIESDAAAARARGARWIVPYMHVAPFADGSSHPSNLDLRSDVGPLFERIGVKIALTSHDQSFERTYPLTGVPDAITRTSLSKRCYTAADGVTYVKVSPAGKLSSKNKNFSLFQTIPAPSWTAVRDDTLHHFSRLRVSAHGVLALETYGVVGDGSAPVLQDRFEYRLDGCPPEVGLSADSLSLSADAGQSATGALDVTSGGQAEDLQASTDSPWLHVAIDRSTGAPRVVAEARTDGLAPGTHRATVTVSATGHVPATATVTLTVVGAHAMQVSSSSSRIAPAPLEGRTVSGTIYAFLTPETGVQGVKFWLDNPAMTGTPRTTENNPPWDFAGGYSNGTAKPFDTRKIADGTHTISALVALTTGGTKTVHTTFTVDN